MGDIARVGHDDAHLLRADLTRMGMSDADVRRSRRAGEVTRLFRGAYVTERDRERDHLERGRVVAALDPRRFTGPLPIVTGPAAALLHGLPLLRRPPRAIHVLRRTVSGPSSRGLLRQTGWAADVDTTSVDGVPVVLPARAVLDTARLMGVADGVVAADAALRCGAVGPDDLGTVTADLRGLRGVARARRCASLADARSESVGESWSAVVLDDAGIPTPERQEIFRDARGIVGRVDFWWPGQRVVGEFDGRVKYGRSLSGGRSPEDVLWDEKRREDRLRALGLTVVRWTAADLHAPTSLIRRLRTVLSTSL